MKEIKYNNKTIKLPFADADYSDTPLEMETVKNPFSGEKCELPDFAATIYYNIKDAEWTKHYDVMQKGLGWFSRNFTKQYMILLD